MVKMVELFDRSLKGGIIAFCGRSLRDIFKRMSARVMI